MVEIPIRDENDTGEEDTSPPEENAEELTLEDEGLPESDALPESDEETVSLAHKSPELEELHRAGSEVADDTEADSGGEETEEIADEAQDFDFTKEYPAEERSDWPPSGDQAHYASGREADIAAVPPVDAKELEEEFEFHEFPDDLSRDVKLELARLHEEVRDSRENARENLDLAQRKHAELINFRKRMKQESDVYKKLAIENLLIDLFPVLDSLQKAVWDVPEEERDSPVAEGMRRTLDLMISILVKRGVTVIQESLVPFNPAMHTPLSFEVKEDIDDGTVLEVYQYGFKLADRIVRPAMVKVSRREDKEAQEAEAADEKEIEKGEEKYASLDEMIELSEDE